MPHNTRTNDEIRRVRGLLPKIFEAAGAAAADMTYRPLHLLHLARVVRHQIAHARETMVERGIPAERVLREMELAVAREPERLRATSGRLEFAEAVLALTAEAVERIEREDDWSPRYAALAPSDAENAFVSASSAAAGKRWQPKE